MSTEGTLFFRVENIYLIPVLRQRLAFSILVRRALQALSAETEWDPAHDLICVSLPPSVAPYLREGIDRLPDVSQIWAEDSARSAREIFPVTPCDAFVEAVRAADELSGAVHFIDLEILPGNILRHPCERDPDWPDDTLVKAIGVDRYVRLVTSQLSYPPMRFEPVDTWRETHILRRLRALHPAWRRILFVCDMTLSIRLIGALRSRSITSAFDSPADKPARLRLHKALSLSVLLNYLDDYPKLVERFEEERYSTDVEFDKFECLLEEIQEFIKQTKDITVSTRQIDKLSILLKNHLLYSRRRCPDPASLFDCVQGCFGRAVAERLHCHLSSYFQQVRVERVRPSRLVATHRMRYQLDVTSAQGGFESRECDPTMPRYFIEPPTPPPSGGGNEIEEYQWPPELMFLKSMQKKLSGLSQMGERRRRTRLFSGSIDAGIDIRRTLRSQLAPFPALYVKSMVREPTVQEIELEPVLWILSEDFGSRGFQFGSRHYSKAFDRENARVTGPKPGGSFFISAYDIQRWPEGYEELMQTRLHQDERASVDIFGIRRLGRVTFGDQFDSEEQARAAYGSNFERRIPNHEEFDHPDERGCVHPDVMPIYEDGGTWLEIAAMTAMKYSNEVVLVVAPTGLRIPNDVMRQASVRNKRFVFVSIEGFSREERDKLRTHYRLATRGDDKERTWSHLSGLMRRFWT